MIDLYPAVRPVLLRLDPELAHRLALEALRTGLVPADPGPDQPILAQTLWGLRFASPVGLAAGFDKDAVAVAPLLRLGFGFVEVGTVTPRPQPGNPPPRMFRLPAQGALINRLGFNNLGAELMAARLSAWRSRPAGPRPAGVVGVNLGRNRDSTDEIGDYVAGVRRLGPLADYLTVNVSSPNTPGLRGLQEPDRLAALLAAVLAAREEGVARGAARPPLLLKLSPDLTEPAAAACAEVALSAGVDGLIISNTTIDRPPGLPPALAAEAGGLSGRPLFGPSTRLLAFLYRQVGGRLPLIGVGGIASAADAYAKVRAGASLIQLYTAFIYRGPRLVREIRTGLAALLRRDGFASVAEAVGTGAVSGPAA